MTVAAVAFVAYLNPIRNTATRVITGLLTRRHWTGYPKRAQLLFVCILFSVLSVVDLYLAFSSWGLSVDDISLALPYPLRTVKESVRCRFYSPTRAS